MIIIWCIMINRLKVSPVAVARLHIAQLDKHENLSSFEEMRIVDAIESCGVPDAIERVLASISKQALKTLLEEI